MSALRKSSAIALACLLAGCAEAEPVEIDGDVVRARIGDIVRGSPESGRAEAELLALAGRAAEARDLIFREVDRARRTAAVRAEDARAEELAALAGGRPLTGAEQARLAEVVGTRAQSERAREALAKLLSQLR